MTLRRQEVSMYIWSKPSRAYINSEEFLRFSTNSEALASELTENFKACFVSTMCIVMSLTGSNIQ